MSTAGGATLETHKKKLSQQLRVALSNFRATGSHTGHRPFAAPHHASSVIPHRHYHCTDKPYLTVLHMSSASSLPPAPQLCKPPCCYHHVDDFRPHPVTTTLPQADGLQVVSSPGLPPYCPTPEIQEQWGQQESGRCPGTTS